MPGLPDRPHRRALLAGALAASALRAVPGARAQSAPEALTLRAADGLAIRGSYLRAAHPRALVLLFHQAGAGLGEYATIAPVLARAGYSSLAIDQRAGGGLFGRNETAARAGGAGYRDAEQDLDAALAWAGTEAAAGGANPAARPLPVVLWGSSYSAALVFLVAAAHPGQVAGLLAFSPGEYLGGGAPVRAAAATVAVPVYATSASDPGEIAAARAILAAVPARKVQTVPRAGEHGSSTLIPARNPAGAADNWPPVLSFLDSLAP